MEQPVVHHLENKQGRKHVDGEEEGFKGGGVNRVGGWKKMVSQEDVEKKRMMREKDRK